MSTPRNVVMMDDEILAVRATEVLSTVRSEAARDLAFWMLEYLGRPSDKKKAIAPNRIPL